MSIVAQEEKASTKLFTNVNLCGETLDPYFEGKLGVLEAGAYVDILIIDGNPFSLLLRLK